MPRRDHIIPAADRVRMERRFTIFNSRVSEMFISRIRGRISEIRILDLYQGELTTC